MPRFRGVEPARDMVNCEGCGRVFTPTSGNQKYCSTKCKELVREKKRKGEKTHDTLTEEMFKFVNDGRRRRGRKKKAEEVIA